MLLVLLGGTFAPANAQTKDVITFTGGQEDSNNPDIYVVNAGPDDVIINPEGGNPKVRIRLSRPLGATATQAATIIINNLNQPWDEGTSVTFNPGETEKTVDIETYTYAFDSYNGYAPAVFSVLSTKHAEAAYDVVIYNINHTPTEEPQECSFATPLEAIQGVGIDYREIHGFRWGKYMLLSFDLGVDMKISENSRLVIQKRFVDHKNLPVNADDYGMSKIHNVVLKPINAGAISNIALYLYKPSDDEYMYSFRNDIAYNGLVIDNSVMDEGTPKELLIGIQELGPFEVAKPANGAMTSLFFSQEDLKNTFFLLHYPMKSFIPKFSNVTLDKTSYKSGETMVITAKMDNWQLIKRARMDDFKNSFGVTFDGLNTIEPLRYNFDETTGMVTYAVPAPDVNGNVNVDFGGIENILLYYDHETGDFQNADMVIAEREGSFSVDVTEGALTPVASTAVYFTDIPADGSLIELPRTKLDDGNYEVNEAVIHFKAFCMPFNSNDGGQITYSVTSPDGAQPLLTNAQGEPYNNVGNPCLHTGVKSGTITVTATLNDQISTSRTYTLRKAPGMVVHCNNKYIVGTSFPKFQFQLEGWDEWTVDEKGHPEGAVTVNYTHANGTTWTEHYKLSQLKKQQHESISSAVVYDLPFGFTEEHPDVTDEQVGQPIVTAQVLIYMDNHGEKATAEATATLTPDLKPIAWDDFSYAHISYNNVRPATVTTEVGHLPRRGFTVGYWIQEWGIEVTYSNLSGDPLPDWLTLEEEGEFYYTAHINAIIDMTGHELESPYVATCSFYTIAQRSCIPNEEMLRHLTRVCNISKMGDAAYIYKVNGEEVTGDLTFDNSANIQAILNTIQTEGFYQYTFESNKNYKYPSWVTNHMVEDVQLPIDPLHLPSATFDVGDTYFDGANITLSCEDKVIQTLTGFKGGFSFQPPCDGRTYTLKVYFPGYDRTFNSTFVSADLTHFYHINATISGYDYSYPVTVTHFVDGEPKTFHSAQSYPYDTDYCKHTIYGITYMPNPSKCYIDLKYWGRFRLSFENYLYKLKPNIKPELDFHWPHRIADPYNEIRKHYWTGNDFMGWHPYYYHQSNIKDLGSDYTAVTVVNEQGDPIENATVSYACVDAEMRSIEGTQGSTVIDNNLGCYPAQTDAAQFAQLFEVLAEGYEPTLSTLYLWNYDYNKSKVRRHTIVLHQDANQLKSLTFETPKREGVVKDNKMDATINAVNMLMMNEDETLNYSQTADQENVTKHIYDAKFGSEGWHGTKYAHLTGMLSYTGTLEPALQLEGLAQQPTYATTLLTTADFPFSQNYCLFDFDLTDKIEDNAKFTLKNGTTTLAALPTLHNNDLDKAAMDEASRVSLAFDSPVLNDVDDQAEDNGVDMKDSGKAFDKFNFQLPPVLPFTVNIERDGDYFIVRACMEKNFLPGGQLMNTLDKLGDYQYFDEQFQACMDAVNSGKPADDDFFDDIPRWPSAFLGIKGYLSGIGYYDRENGKFEFTFLDGGIVFEASAAAQANLSFGIGAFGMSIDAKMAMTLGLVNTAAEMGDVSVKSTTIDFIFDYQARLKVCAWAYAGIDLWIAKAVAGVRGGACIDLHHRAYVRKGLAGMKTTLQAKMEAFAEARFLFWSVKKTWPIFNVYKEYLVPNSPSNPFHPANEEPMFTMSRRNVTKGYKKLRRKVIADLGTPIISNVNGMAQPTYLLGGESLLFNNLKTASDYNDDRIQLFDGSSKNNLVDTGIDAPMYDFAEAHNNNGLELVAFEQIKETIDDSELDAMSDKDQTKSVTEKSEIHVAMRTDGGSWTTKTVGSYFGNIGCVTPAVAVQSDGKAAVIWQQGIAKFSDQGSRYIDGSLMLKRYDGSKWDKEPIEIKRLHRRSVPADYQVSMKQDSILVMMTLQQDVEDEEKQASVVYVSISPDNKVRERYTQTAGVKPQMVSVNGANLVGYIKASENGRDIVLNTVNMKGEPTGKLSGSLGMNKRTVNDFKLVVEDDAVDLEDVGLLWTQSDQESTDNGDGTQTVLMKNRIYASKLCSHDKILYFSTPVVVATMPDDVSLASMDGYLADRDMKVAYCVTNEQDGGAVMETSVEFNNDIDHKVNFNAYNVNSESQVPVTVTVANNGFEPINSIDVTLNGETTTHEVMVMPQEKTELTAYCLVDDNFDGTIDYDVTANFTAGNSNALKSRRRRVMSAAPRRVIKQEGTQLDVRQVDMALKVLSKKTEGETTTVVAEVNNASLLPLDGDVNVKVGLYDTPIVDEKSVCIASTSVNASDLYDASEKQNKVKIVNLSAPIGDIPRTLYLRTTPMKGSEEVKDVRPANNVVPVSQTGKYKRGDANKDGSVSVTDIAVVVNDILQLPNTQFLKYGADANADGGVTVTDIGVIVDMILGSKTSAGSRKMQQELEPQ